MEANARKTMVALASVGGDATAVHDGKPRLHQNAPSCTTQSLANSPTSPSLPPGVVSRVLPTGADGPAPTPAAVDEGRLELSAQKLAAVAMLMSGRTFSQAAEQLGLDRSTIFRWRREPAFNEELKRRLAETLDVVAARARDQILRSSTMVNEAMRSDARFMWAFKVMTSKRVWDIAQTLPSVPGE